MIRRTKLLASVIGVVVSSALFVAPSSLAIAQRAEGSPLSEDAGAAVIVDSANSDRELTEFDSTELFRVRLPDGASCAGDSANDYYNVQTFLVPAGTDIASLSYRQRSPDGSDLYRPLFFNDGEVATQMLLNENSAAGKAGLILEPVLPYSFAFYNANPANALPAGQWTLGVACTPSDWVVDRFWDVEVILESAADVGPGALRIRVVEDTTSAGSAGQSASGTGAIVPVLAGLAALAFLGLLLRSRRRARQERGEQPPVPSPPIKEYQ